MFTLTILHIIGVIWVVLLALSEIKTIIPSGLILTAFSVLLALLAYRRNRTASLYYALAAPTVSVLCFALIYGLHWSPDQARKPIGFLLTFFGLFNVPLGIAALRELWRPPPTVRRKGPFQYSIASIMGLTLVVGISLSLIKTWEDRGIALAAVFCHFVFVTYLLRRFHQPESP